MIGVAIPMLTTFPSQQRKLEHTGIVDVSNYNCNWKVSAQQPFTWHSKDRCTQLHPHLQGLMNPVATQLHSTHPQAHDCIDNIGLCFVMMQSKAY